MSSRICGLVWFYGPSYSLEGVNTGMCIFSMTKDLFLVLFGDCLAEGEHRHCI